MGWRRFLHTFFEFPDLFEKILSNDRGADTAVKSSYQAFEAWIAHSGMPFFPGYTDHGITHINDTLNVSTWIISENATELISPKDVMVLMLAVLLHDVAMSITEDSFRKLVTTSKILIKDLDDKTWIEVWEEYLGEVSRFDSRKLVRISGAPDPYDVKKLDLDNIKERDRYFIGEFIRRHHGRLAHEIAVDGVPGPHIEKISLSQVKPDMADLVGIVARSHSMSLRSCFRYLEENYDLRSYENTHVIYLMCIVRIADYIQLHSQRANKELLKVRTLRSPLSREEWQLHHSVRDIRFTHPDPEAIDIDAIPQSIKGYFKLSSLLADMQKELDECWAVLGEVYGRYAPWDRLGLRIRRVRSTIEDEKKIKKKLDFLPVKAAFDAAGVDLLKLLIHPLYGDSPGIGIRELIQNSVDACREAANIKDSGLNTALIFSDPPFVEVIFSGKDQTVTIRDNGVGMTLDTVINYFLKAGATYRKSDAWKKHHSDERGKSKIIRGGRFGVGVLATYLLGDKFEVTTRHFTDSEDKALHFSASLDDDQIQISNTIANIGTKIIINVDDKTWEKFTPGYRLKDKYIENWSEMDWYCISNPKVTIKYIGKQEYELKPYYSVPNLSDKLPDGWYNLKAKGYDAIHWTYYEKSPALTCNGIIVKREWEYFRNDLWRTNWRSSIIIRKPSLSVYDSQGIFPLNLQRTDVSVSNLEFSEKLSEEVAKDFMAFFLIHSPTSTNKSSLKQHFDNLKSYKGITYEDLNNWYPFLITNEGIAFFDVGIVQKLKINRLICIPNFSLASDNTFTEIPNGTALVVFNYSQTYEPDLLRLVRLALGLSYAPGTIKSLTGIKGRIFLTKSNLKIAQTPGKIAKHFHDRMKVEWEDSDHVVVTNDTDSNTGLLEFIARCKTGKDKDKIMHLVEWQISNAVNSNYAISPVGKTMFINDWPLLIPFLISERKKIFAKVCRSLSARMAYYEGKNKSSKVAEEDVDQNT